MTKVAIFQKHLQKFADTSTFRSFLSQKEEKSELILASKGSLIFLERILKGKQHSGGLTDEKEKDKLLESLDKLIECNKDPKFQHFKDFFVDAETFLDPLTTLQDFESSLCKLIPTHEYLKKYIFSDTNYSDEL